MRCLPPSLSLVVHIFWLSTHVATGAIGVPDLGLAPQIQEQSAADEITSKIDEEELRFFSFERAGDSTGGRVHEGGLRFACQSADNSTVDTTATGEFEQFHGPL